MSNYNPVKDTLYIGRKSSRKETVHERLLLIDMNKELKPIQSRNLTLLGYACDEGVRRNKGRTGARDGPDHIRRQWAKMPWQKDEVALFDAGTITCNENELEAAQEALGETVFRLLQAGYFPVIIGGGHDMSYGHFLGVHRYLEGKPAVGIINFDAHLDLRVPVKQGNSGTPFHQIHDLLVAEGLDFRYACLGMRPDANIPELIQRAKEWDTTIIERDLFHLENWKGIRSRLEAFISGVERILLTIDMDGFSSAFAPGVSAASPMGFAPDIVLRCLDYLAQTGKVISMDIAETNPAYDRDHQTAKLAASLIHRCGNIPGSL